MIVRGLLLLSALCLVSCKSMNVDIINGTGCDIEIVVKGLNGATLAYGTLKQGTSLIMKEYPREIELITYRSDKGEECMMKRDHIRTSARKYDGIWIIKLIAC